MFTTNPYSSHEIYFNSSVNKRGVGILIKKCSPFTVLAEKRDCEENILILHVRHTASGKEFWIGSIYSMGRTNMSQGFSALARTGR